MSTLAGYAVGRALNGGPSNEAERTYLDQKGRPPAVHCIQICLLGHKKQFSKAFWKAMNSKGQLE